MLLYARTIASKLFNELSAQETNKNMKSTLRRRAISRDLYYID